MSTLTITARDSQNNTATKNVTLNVDANPTPGKYPTVMMGATTNDNTGFTKVNTAWGPIRGSREYDSGKGIVPVNNYAWFNFVTVQQKFPYLIFSCDEGNGDYPRIAAGAFDNQIQAMIDSVKTKLVGVKGVIALGNEPNADKGIPPADYRAALEHVIDKFGDEPAPNFLWGVEFSNYNVWGGGSKAGELWLPRQDGIRFSLGTHVYGRTDHTPFSNSIGRTFIPAFNKTGREKWIWGIGETSAKEIAGSPNAKGEWFQECIDYTVANKGSFYAPFDTGVGGSDEVGSTPRTAALVKEKSLELKNNNWSDF